MKNIIDFILESKGQRISQRENNRPYDVKDDELLKKKESRPEKAQQLRETKTDKSVQEFCSGLVNDFIVKLYQLNKDNDSLLWFDRRLSGMLEELDKDNKLNNIEPVIDKKQGGCIFLSSSDNIVLPYKSSDSFTNILNNLKELDLYYRSERDYRDDTEYYTLGLGCKPKFFASILHKLRKHDLAKKVENASVKYISDFNIFDLFTDLSDNYNKNYFADKFKEFETAYNDVLSNW